MSDHVHEYHWYPAMNEEGWRCCSCGHKAGEHSAKGFSAELDRSELGHKVHGLLAELHAADFISISNSCEGGSIVGWVEAQCRELDLYDQNTICRLIFVANKSHTEYWAKISRAILAGEDDRLRCPGGRLSQCSTGCATSPTGWTERCFDPSCPSCAAAGPGF